MKRLQSLALCGALTLAGATFASADMVERKTTETETTFSGTVSEFAPGSSSITVRSEAGVPSQYAVTSRTTYVDADGNTVTREKISNQPVTIFYTKDGDTLTASKIVVTRPGKTVRETTTERRTTTE